MILLYEGQISSINDILPLLESAAKSRQPILFIADEIDGEALATLVVNKLRGTLQCAAVKAPGIGDRRTATLQDISVLTGAKFFSLELGIHVSNVRSTDLGTAKRVEIGKDETRILEGGGDPALIAERAQTLRRAIQNCSSSFDKGKLQERLAHLVAGIAVIRTGGGILQEAIDEEYRVSSALHSSTYALEGGCVLGGGLTLYNSRKSIEKMRKGTESETVAARILSNALEAPIRTLIIENSKSSPTQILSEIKATENSNIGYNALTCRVEDMVEAGILDPAKSVCFALHLALAYIKTLLQTGTWDLGAPTT